LTATTSWSFVVSSRIEASDSTTSTTNRFSEIATADASMRSCVVGRWCHPSLYFILLVLPMSGEPYLLALLV
jgi:hypothetical protein